MIAQTLIGSFDLRIAFRKIRFSIRSILLCTSAMAVMVTVLSFPLPRWRSRVGDGPQLNAEFTLHNPTFALMWVKSNDPSELSQFSFCLLETEGTVRGSYSTSWDEWHVLMPWSSMVAVAPVTDTTRSIKVGVTVSDWFGRKKLVWSEYQLIDAAAQRKNSSEGGQDR